MWAGAAALQEKAPCLVVGIDGLRGFSSGQIVQTLKVKWPALRDATIDLPGNARQGPKYAEHMARALELPQARKQLADMISPHLGNVRYVGLPAILGVHHSVEAIRDLTKMLGVSVFEIPTMPPAITGLRLKEAFDNYLPKLGVKTFYHYKVLSVTRRKDGIFTIIIGRSEPEKTIIAENLLLASGRFLGKGLTAGRDGIHETLLDLPVAQPTHRSQWHHESFLAPGGHALNQAGVEVDRRFRPQTTDGVPVYANLYAAGSILAHQDWMRSKSGVGLAAATAFGAVSAIAKTYAPGSLKNASLIPKTAYTPST
jgi:glycerol-3-phosphate dehydrogenase subunit B